MLDTTGVPLCEIPTIDEGNTGGFRVRKSRGGGDLINSLHVRPFVD